MSFSDRAYSVLAAAGWSPERAIDISDQVAALEGDGYTVFDSVRAFLARFGRMVLEYAHYKDPTRPDRATLDAVEAAAGVFPETVSSWSAALGQGVCPIGQAFSDHMTLVMAADGSVYAGYDDTLVRVGRSGEEAIENLTTGAEPEPVAGAA